MKQMHSKEFDALLQLPAPDRYALFIRRVADWEEVWSLRTDDDWCLVSDENGVQAFPVWPDQQFAAACVNSIDKETSAKISLQDWLENEIVFAHHDRTQMPRIPPRFIRAFTIDAYIEDT
jgi:Protein of unknown function (DUF2750)